MNTDDKPIVIPKSVLEKVELLRKARDGEMVIVRGGRQHGWTWAQNILDAEDAEISQQKLLNHSHDRQ